VASVAGQITGTLSSSFTIRGDLRASKALFGGADDRDHLLSLDHLAILRDGLDRVMLIVARESGPACGLLIPPLALISSIADLRTRRLISTADERRRTGQRAGKADLDRLLRPGGN